MKTLRVTKYNKSKYLTLSLDDDITVVNTLSSDQSANFVARYIKFYQPYKLIFNNKEFEEEVLDLLKKMY